MPYLGVTPEGDHTRLKLLSMALKVGSFGYFVHDLQKQIITWAPDTYRIWGVDYAPGIPNPAWMLQTVHPDDRHIVESWRADSTWTTKVVDFRIVRPDGDVRNIHTHMERSHLADGRVDIAYGIVLDRTEHRHTETALEQSEARFRTLFESSGAGIVITSSRAIILFINTAFANLLGYAPEELLGQSIRDLSPPETKDATLEMVQDMRRGLGSSRDVEKPYLHRNGELVWARLTINQHITAKGEEEFIGVIQDLTDRHRAEEALRRESLKADAANRAKTLFLANMSHELRTPLNAILGFGQLLAVGTKGALNTDQKNYVDNIVRGGEHLLSLINDVLDLSLIDSGHFPLAHGPANVMSVCDAVLSSFGQIAAAQGVTLHFENSDAPPVMIDADHMRLTQVLTNLVSNAVKYNHVGGEVMVSVKVRGKSRVRISVQDNGQGIPKDRQPEVFQRFNRLGAESQGIEGSGIGLALSKRLVEEMRGTIGFESKPNVSTTFWFELSISQSDYQATLPQAAQ